MAISNAAQTLPAAFAFGSVTVLAVGAAFLSYNTYGSGNSRNGRRLVLIIFFLFAALWAKVEFVDLLIPVRAVLFCQINQIFTTAFDQLAKVSFEQYLLWSLNSGSKFTAVHLLLQGSLFVRIIAGGVFLGFTRPDFRPTCLARRTTPMISIVVMGLDSLIIWVLIIRSLVMMLRRNRGNSSFNPNMAQIRAYCFVLLGFVVWVGSSAPMILGFSSFNFLIKTVLPASTLGLLIGVTIIFSDPLASFSEKNTLTSEASSPFMSPTPPSQESSNPTALIGSPASGYLRGPNLYVVNPSNTPRDSPIPFKPSRGAKISEATPRNLSDRDVFDSSGAQNMTVVPLNEESVKKLVEGDEYQFSANQAPGYRGSSGIFPSSQVDNQAAMAPAIISDLGPKYSTITSPAPLVTTSQKRTGFKWNIKSSSEKISIRNLPISKPIISNNDESNIQPFNRIPTIDLHQAITNDRKRREAAAAKFQPIASKSISQSPSTLATELYSPEEAKKIYSFREQILTPKSVEDSEVVADIRLPFKSLKSKFSNFQEQNLSPGSDCSSDAGSSTGSSTSIVQINRDEVRRRSPRLSINSYKAVNETKARQRHQFIRKTSIDNDFQPQSSGRIELPSAGMKGQERVFFLNDIVYDNPEVVENIMKQVPAPKTIVEEPYHTDGKFSKRINPDYTTSIIHRPRPIKRNLDRANGIGRRRSKSVNTYHYGIGMSNQTLGSPNDLPPLPPLPARAANLKRLLQEDSAIMTHEEKVRYLFPPPPQTQYSKRNHKRHSSLPSLNHALKKNTQDSVTISKPSPEKNSDLTPTENSFYDIKAIPEFSRPPYGSASKSPAKEFSSDIYMKYAPSSASVSMDTESSYLPFSDNLQAVDSKKTLERRAKTPSLTISDATSVDLSDLEFAADQKPYNYDKRSNSNPSHKLFHKIDESSLVSSEEETNYDEMVTVMLDSESIPSSIDQKDEIVTVMLESEKSRQSFMKEIQGSNRPTHSNKKFNNLYESEMESEMRNYEYQRMRNPRATFSGNRLSMSKKQNFPPPLIFDQEDKSLKVNNYQEPSPPIDSPQREIVKIEADLLEARMIFRSSTGSLLRELPTNISPSSNNDSRLIENIEKEMEKQSDQWLRMQSYLDRRSTGITMALYENDLSQRTESFYTANDSRRSNISIESLISPTLQESSISAWQRRLAETQKSYTDLHRRSSSYAITPIIQAGNPTPPESSESDSETTSEFEYHQATPRQKISHLRETSFMMWRASTHSTYRALGRLWNPPSEPIICTNDDPPAKSLRPPRRYNKHKLSIVSHKLWSKNRSKVLEQYHPNLWSPATTESKEMSTPLLILQNETSKENEYESETKIYSLTSTENPYDFNTPILGSERLENEYNFLQNENQELSSSQNEVSNENTLRRIVCLLKTNQYSIKQDYLLDSEDEFSPSRKTNAITTSNELKQNENPRLENFVSQLPIQPLSIRNKNSFESQLWKKQIPNIEPHYGLTQPSIDAWNINLSQNINNFPRTKVYKRTDLPTLQSNTLWNHERFKNHLSLDSFTSKSSKESSGTGDKFNKMWYMRSTAEKVNDVTAYSHKSIKNSNSVQPSTGMKINTLSVSKEIELTYNQYFPDASYSRTMWNPPYNVKSLKTPGLFDAKISRNDFRRTSADPAAIQMIKAPRNESSSLELSDLSSSRLWVRRSLRDESVNWMKVSDAANDEGIDGTDNLMWNKPIDVTRSKTPGLFDAKISRNDFRRTSAEPAAIQMIKAPRNESSSLELSDLSSSRLWVRRSLRDESVNWMKVSDAANDEGIDGTDNLMWNKPIDVTRSKTPGLFDAKISRNDFRRTSAEPAAIQMIKAPRNESSSLELSDLSSSRLWVRRSLRDESVNWMKVSDAANDEGIVEDNLMWNKPIDVTRSKTPGLFDAKISRNDFRRTSAEPAAIQMIKAPRNESSSLELSDLSSSRLWVRRSLRDESVNWMKVSDAANDEGIDGTDNLMWNKPIDVTRSKTPGLFDAEISRNDFRRTSAEPAAIQMIKAPRNESSSLELSDLSSPRLWVRRSLRDESVNWMKVSDAANDEGIDGTDNLMWNKPIDVTRSKTPGLFDAEISRNDFRRTSAEPAAIQMIKAPRNESSSLELSDLSSSRLWVRRSLRDESVNWMKVSDAANDEGIDGTDNLMWNKPIDVTRSKTPGLFDAKISRNDFRRTSAEPAAIQMIKAPRNESSSLELSDLSSSRLWVRRSLRDESVNWMKVSDAANDEGIDGTDNLMWNKPIDVTRSKTPGLFDAEISRNDFRRTSAEPAAIQMIKAPRNESSSLELSDLSSSRLWVRRSLRDESVNWMKVSDAANDEGIDGTDNLMWNKPIDVTRSKTPGLFDAEISRNDFRRTSAEPAAIQMIKAPRNESSSLELSDLSSSRLWVRRSLRDESVNWMKVSDAANDEGIVEDNLMWNKPIDVTRSKTPGLFDAEISRNDFRRTSAEPAAIQMIKAPRNESSSLELSDLSSSRLWVRRSLRDESVNWMKVSDAANDEGIDGTDNLMWNKPIDVTRSKTPGLFDAEISRNDFRRTSAEPAAIQMIKAPRNESSSLELSDLSSSRLWVRRSLRDESVNWMKVSDAANDEGIDGTDNLMWNKPIDVTRSKTPGLFDAEISRNDFRRTSAEPAAIQMIKAPRNESSSLELSDLSSPRLWVRRSLRDESVNWMKVSDAANDEGIDGTDNLMWNKPIDVTRSKTPGLFDAKISRNDFRRTSAEPAAIQMIKAPRNESSSLELSDLSSPRLWVRRSLRDESVNWMKVSDAANDEGIDGTDNLMWNKPIDVTRSKTPGLFDAKISRNDFRRTSAEPAAIQMIKAPRNESSSLELSDLSSSRLWVRRSLRDESVNWMLIVKTPVDRQIESENWLWKKRHNSEHLDMTDLFDANKMDNFITQRNEQPAASGKSYNRRAQSMIPMNIISNNLWNGNSKIIVERDVKWISESSIRPDSPTNSIFSSVTNSPLSDGWSIRSTSTMASSLWSNGQNSNRLVAELLEDEASENTQNDLVGNLSRISTRQKFKKSILDSVDEGNSTVL
ncbi:BgTH12-07286 [Blumeria graminis f. sp. triticale]|uniref:BgTH12-07286 n=1 Tax=Blumeria graminis f. sp. triticale TaxID=1689686 RepID=A0A9W4GJX9_BLUGR|nr:BgTH12-07286 [Blumeria graminis f. sp. triticale]